MKLLKQVLNRYKARNAFKRDGLLAIGYASVTGMFAVLAFLLVYRIIMTIGKVAFGQTKAYFGMYVAELHKTRAKILKVYPE
jgi:hypothetical protein